MNHLFNRPFIRGIEADNLLEIFFVTAVASVLGIRFFLRMTGYPQLSGKGLHIAHVLLGGMFMLFALLILLAFINKSACYVASVLGGFGFGAFIDELGKFITGDNNYFFQPAVALIYVTFILIYLIIEAINKQPLMSQQEKLINVLEITKEAVLKDLDYQERRNALDLLEDCDPSDPIAKALKDLLDTINLVPVPEPSLYTKAKTQMRCFYEKLVQKRWFINVVIAFFIIQAFFSPLLNALALLILTLLGYESRPLSFAELGSLASSMIAAVLIAGGIIKIRSSRLQAYGLFRMAILVQIFLVQFFVFYTEQLYALLSLTGNICVLLVLRYAIRLEKTPQVCQVYNQIHRSKVQP